MTRYRVEKGKPGDAEGLRAIERASGVHFRRIGMNDVADHDGTEAEFLDECAQEGRLYVALTELGERVGFLIWSPKDGCAYIEEVSVRPDHAGHKLAARLLDRLADDVRGRYPALTLATFRDVPWNAPYYASLGFAEIPREKLGPDHDETWREQIEYGLDMSRRLFMTRPIA